MPTFPDTNSKTAANEILPEHTRVRLRHALPKGGLHKGAKGTIVHIYEDGGYEVEFIEGLERPSVVTLEQADVEEVTGE